MADTSEAPGIDRAVKVAMQSVYTEGFEAGRALGYTEGIRAAQQQLIVMLPEGSLSGETALEELDLTVRAYNHLKREGINTIGALLQMTDEMLREIRNLGQGGIDEIDKKLLAAGFARKRR